MSKVNKPNTRNRVSNSKYGGKKHGGKKPPYRSYSGNKQDRRAEEIADDAASMSRSNPISFYNKYKQYSTDASRLPFSTPAGFKFNNLFTSPTAPNVIRDSNDYVVPGIMSLRFSATIGPSANFNSPINRSSIQFITYLRSIMKAAKNYDHQDVTMFTLSLDSCVMFHSLLKRVYGLLRDTTPLNKYYCQAIIEASGVDYFDIINNIQDFRAYINQFAYNLQAYALPDGIELFNRHQWMCEGIYTDSGSTRAQSYIFVPLGFWQYDNTVSTGSQLTFKYWAWDTTSNQPALLKFSDIVDFGNSLYNAIANDEDFSEISGDMYTLYQGRTRSLPYLDEMYQILPKYDETVLSQIENATICGLFHPQYTPLISQNPSVNQGAVLYNPILTAPNAQLYGDVAVNFHHDSPTPDQILEATRLTVVTAPKNQDDWSTTNLDVVTSGSEIIHVVNVFGRQNGLSAKIALSIMGRKTMFPSTVNSTSLDQVIGLVSEQTQIAQFDWAPRLEIFQNYQTEEDTEPSIHLIGTTWDIDNISQVSIHDLTIMHDACLWSEFDVPRMSAGR